MTSGSRSARSRAAQGLAGRLAHNRLFQAALVVAVLATAAFQYWRPRKQRLYATTTIEVHATPIGHFARRDASRTRFGRLTFRGGLVLSSPSAAFGGWSALALDAQGRRLIAVSDSGNWMSGELTYAGDRPTGIAGAAVGPLRGIDGEPFARGRDRDTEAIAITSGSVTEGEAIVAFEQYHRLGRFPVGADGIGPAAEILTLPPATAGMSRNKGLEAVCVIAGGPSAGAIVTLAERFPGTTDTHTGWIGTREGDGWRRLAIAVIDDHDLTDCHGLPDGGIVVLERRFHMRDWTSGPRMRLRRFTAHELASGQRMLGETLVEAGPAEDIDNMEGLAVHTDAAGKTVLSLISDDNFNHGLQRTVLLQFVLEPAAP